jgi:hypothetical protein
MVAVVTQPPFAHKLHVDPSSSAAPVLDIVRLGFDTALWRPSRHTTTNEVGGDGEGSDLVMTVTDVKVFTSGLRCTHSTRANASFAPINAAAAVCSPHAKYSQDLGLPGHHEA